MNTFKEYGPRPYQYPQVRPGSVAAAAHPAALVRPERVTHKLMSHRVQLPAQSSSTVSDVRDTVLTGL